MCSVCRDQAFLLAQHLDRSATARTWVSTSPRPVSARCAMNPRQTDCTSWAAASGSTSAPRQPRPATSCMPPRTGRPALGTQLRHGLQRIACLADVAPAVRKTRPRSTSPCPGGRARAAGLASRWQMIIARSACSTACCSALVRTTSSVPARTRLLMLVLALAVPVHRACGQAGPQRCSISMARSSSGWLPPGASPRRGSRPGVTGFAVTARPRRWARPRRHRARYGRLRQHHLPAGSGVRPPLRPPRRGPVTGRHQPDPGHGF